MRGTQEVLDEMLVLASQSGDAHAFEILARRWHPRLVRHAVRFTKDADAAAEAAQEAWIGIVRGIRRLRDPARFGPWARRIVRHKARDWIRRQTRRRSASEEAWELERWRSVHGPAARVEPRLEIRRAMRRLTEEQVTILRLFYVDDLPVVEISEALGIPVGTVKSRLFYARRALREAVLARRDGRTGPLEGAREAGTPARTDTEPDSGSGGER